MAAQSSSCLLLITVSTLSELPSLLHSCFPHPLAVPITEGIWLLKMNPNAGNEKLNSSLSLCFGKQRSPQTWLFFLWILLTNRLHFLAEHTHTEQNCDLCYRYCLWRHVSTWMHPCSLKNPCKSHLKGVNHNKPVATKQVSPLKFNKNIQNHWPWSKQHYAWISLWLFPLGSTPHIVW